MMVLLYLVYRLQWVRLLTVCQSQLVVFRELLRVPSLYLQAIVGVDPLPQLALFLLYQVDQEHQYQLLQCPRVTGVQTSTALVCVQTHLPT